MLLSVLAAATAAATLGRALDLTYVWILALAVGAVGAVLRILIALFQSRIGRQREHLRHEGLFRARAARVSEIDPIEIGVDRAEQRFLPGGSLPRYLPRTADRRLRAVLKRALDGSDRAFVVVYGPAKVGKSRTLFEALRQLCEDGRHDLLLIAPRTGDALRELLQPDLMPRRRRRQRRVIWLDDLETFIAQGVDGELLRSWQERGKAIVVATYGGKGSERVPRERSRELTSLADSLLDASVEVPLDQTTAAELSQLPSNLSAEDRETVERYGLAAALVAAPLLRRRLGTRRQQLGEGESLAGRAVVWAAIDWARSGRVEPISKEQLRELWPAYLPSGPATDEEFAKGLGWALHRVVGSISLLREDDGYLPYDYAVLLAGLDPESESPQEEAWSRALDTEDPSQVLQVAVQAFEYGREDLAIEALERAAGSEKRGIAAAATFNLGVIADKRGDLEAAAAAWEKSMGLDNGDAAFNLALLRIEQKRPEDALSAYRRARKLKQRDGTFNLALMLIERGETKEAKQVLREGADLGDGRCAGKLGSLLLEEDRIDEAETALRRSADLGDPIGTGNLGIFLLKGERDDEAIEVLRRALELGEEESHAPLGYLLWQRGDTDEAEQHLEAAARLEVADGIYSLGLLRLEQKKAKEGLRLLRRAMELGVPDAAYQLGHELKERGKEEEAIEAFRRGLDLGDPRCGFHAVQLLQERGRQQEAISLCQEMVRSENTEVAAAVNELLEAVEAEGQQD